MRLWLDDKRPAPEGWEWIKEAPHALSLIRTGRVVEASLDHDLGDEPWNGYWLLCQIENDIGLGVANYTIPVFRIHTDNSVGLKNMLAAINSIKRLKAA